MTCRYTTITGLGKMFTLSPNSVRKYLSEMEGLPRYRNARVELTLEQKRYNVIAFADYCQHRARLRDRNLSKFVAPYDPIETAKSIGESK